MIKSWQRVIGFVLLTAATAHAAPKAALFVQNRAGNKLEAQLDVFNDLLSSRLTNAGFEVIRYQDVLDRFTESRSAADAQQLRQWVEQLQTAKSEGTVDGTSIETSALRTAQWMGANFLVMASMVSLADRTVSVQAYGTAQDVTTTTLRLSLRVLAGDTGAQLYGDVVAVNEKIAQSAFIQTAADDLVASLLDRGAEELAQRVGDCRAKIAAAAPQAVPMASVTISSSESGAAVEVDGVVIGSAPGTFQIRAGIHEVRVTKEGFATWEKSVAFSDGMELRVPMVESAVGIARKGALEAQDIVREQSEAAIDIAREQSAAEAYATQTVAGGVAASASNSFIRLEGMPNESLSIGGDKSTSDGAVQVIQQTIK